MEWKSFPANVPTETGSYIVSIQRQLPTHQSVFNDCAHWNAEEGRWLRYDAYDSTISDQDITDEVTAWANDLGVFIR